jgi:hypothetical protein
MSKLRERLTAATNRQELVQITRSIRGADRLEGFALDVGRRWLLLHKASHDMFLDGYVAIRVGDVKKVTPWDGTDGFPARALKHFGEIPHAPAPALDLSSTPALLAAVAAISQVVTIHIERKDRTVCYIGKPLGASSKMLWLRGITPAAKWETKLMKWRFRDITRVEFGGRYEQALHAVGGDPPPSAGG